MKRLLVLVLFVAHAAPVMSQAQPSLDLTQKLSEPTVSTASTAEDLRGGMAGAAGGHDVARLPLAVALLEIEPPSCALDGHFVIDVEVRNTGQVAFALPWSPTPITGPDQAGVIEARLSLWIQTPEGGRTQLVGSGHTLYGSSQRGGTLRMLAPREAVVIRAPGICGISDTKVRRGLDRYLPTAQAVSVTLRVGQRGDVGASTVSAPVRIDMVR